MAHSVRRSTPWIFWPIAALWDLVAFVLGVTGRIVGGLLGVGLLLTVTVILVPIGVPLMLVGFLLLVRSVF